MQHQTGVASSHILGPHGVPPRTSEPDHRSPPRRPRERVRARPNQAKGLVVRTSWPGCAHERACAGKPDALVMRPSTPWLINKLAGGSASLHRTHSRPRPQRRVASLHGGSVPPPRPTRTAAGMGAPALPQLVRARVCPGMPPCARASARARASACRGPPLARLWLGSPLVVGSVPCLFIAERLLRGPPARGA